MRGFGTGLSLGSGLGVRYTPESSPSSPSIANGTFTDDTGWTYTNGGGSAQLTIASGVMSYTGGTGPSVSFYKTPVIDCTAPDTTIDFQYEITAEGIASSVAISIGGGVETVGPSTVGVHQVAVTVGASGTDLKIRGTGSAGRTWSLDNLSII